MTKKKWPQPTAAELKILRVLWDQGPSTVKQVKEQLEAATGYTTALKLLQIMTEKELVTRDESQRTHVYQARVNEQSIQKVFVKDMLDRVFGGATDSLVLQALSARKTSPQELKEIKKVLEKFEKENQ